MKKIIVWQDSNQIQAQRGYAMEHIPLLNEIVNAFNELNIGKFTTDDFCYLKTEDAKSFIKRKMLQQISDEDLQLQAGKFSLDRNKIVDFLELPNYHVLSNLMGQLSKGCRLELYDINKTNQVIINEHRFENDVTNNYTLYTETQEQVETLREYQLYLDAINKFNIYCQEKIQFNLVLEGALKNTSFAGTIDIQDNNTAIINREFYNRLIKS
jgi:hypothetical protein